MNSALHLTRVAFEASDLSVLVANIATRASGSEVYFTTRNRPRRTGELIGGHLHFIIRHVLVARVEILRFDEAAEGRTNIVCADRLELVAPVPRRAHQGWRYLAARDAPPPFDVGSGITDLPPALARVLSKLALI